MIMFLRIKHALKHRNYNHINFAFLNTKLYSKKSHSQAGYYNLKLMLMYTRIDRDPGKIPVPVKISLFAGIPVPVKIMKFTGISTGISISNF